MQTHPPVRRRGFTMLELLLTMTMIGLVSLMAFNRVGSMMTQWRVARAAQAYGEELQSAFAIVGRDRRPVRITVVKTPVTGEMELRLTNRAGDTIYRRRNFGRSSAYKLDLINLTPSLNSLLVFPPGLAADTLSITILRDGKYRRVRMLRGGLVQICSNPSTLNGICTPA
jgi:prepilin-type N-terminal cleavage/methylation domain-containing protein